MVKKVKKGITIHVTGKARSGKTTIINKVEKFLKSEKLDVVSVYLSQDYSAEECKRHDVTIVENDSEEEDWEKPKGYCLPCADAIMDMRKHHCEGVRCACPHSAMHLKIIKGD